MHVRTNINANEYMKRRRETKDIIHGGSKQNTVSDRDMYAHTLILAQEQKKLHFEQNNITYKSKILHVKAYQHTYIHPHPDINTYNHRLTYKYTYTNKLTHNHIHKQKQKHKQANKKTSKHIHTYRHTYIHTYI